MVDYEMKYIASFDILCNKSVLLSKDLMFHFIHDEKLRGNCWQAFVINGTEAELIDLTMNREFSPAEPYKWIESFKNGYMICLI